MKILVLAKQVPDTWQERELSLETGWVVRDGAAEPVPDEISERVMEVALGWRDAGADIEVVALTVGPEDSSKTLRKMLAMGADSAVQITRQIDILRAEAARYEARLLENGFIEPRPEEEGGNGENFILTARGAQLLSMLDSSIPGSEHPREVLDEAGEAALTPEVFDRLAPKANLETG